jgi:hypothetical protein
MAGIKQAIIVVLVLHEGRGELVVVDPDVCASLLERSVFYRYDASSLSKATHINTNGVSVIRNNIGELQVTYNNVLLSADVKSNIIEACCLLICKAVGRH